MIGAKQKQDDKVIFEWVVTDDPRISAGCGMVGSGELCASRFNTAGHSPLRVAAELPGLFEVYNKENKVIFRGKCSKIEACIAEDHKALCAPVRLAAAFHKDASFVRYRMGEAVMGVYY